MARNAIKLHRDGLLGLSPMLTDGPEQQTTMIMIERLERLLLTTPKYQRMSADTRGAIGILLDQPKKANVVPLRPKGQKTATIHSFGDATRKRVQ